MSYLPLSHVAAQMVDLYLSIGAVSCVHFARPDAMQVFNITVNMIDKYDLQCVSSMMSSTLCRNRVE